MIPFDVRDHCDPHEDAGHQMDLVLSSIQLGFQIKEDPVWRSAIVNAIQVARRHKILWQPSETPRTMVRLYAEEAVGGFVLANMSATEMLNYSMLILAAVHREGQA